MSAIIFLIVLFAIISTVLVIRHAAGKGASRRPRQTRPTVARPAARASVQKPPVPADSAPAKPGHPRIPTPLPIDLSCLENLPEIAAGNRLKTDHGDIPHDMLVNVEKVSRLLCTRSLVLKGLASVKHEPKELTALVLRDPTLAGQILKTVNSAFYGLRYPVASVFKAVLLLGHVEVRNIIWRSCFADALGSESGPTCTATDGIWQHSFAASRATYALAKSLGLPESDELSTVALLHDIGKVLYLRARPFSGLAIYESGGYSGPKQLTKEMSELNFSHAALGSEVVRKWGLPGESCRTIALHHQPVYSDPNEVDGNRPAVALIYLADILCHCAAQKRSDQDQPPIYLPRDRWLEVLGIRNGLEPLLNENVLRALSANPFARSQGPEQSDGALSGLRSSAPDESRF